MGFSCVCTRNRKHLVGGLGAGSEVSHLINMPHRLTQLNHTLLRFNFPSPIFHFTHPDQPPSTRTHAGYPVGTVFEQSGECTGPLYVPLTDSLSPSAPSLVCVFILLSTTNACKVLAKQACQEGIDGFLISLCCEQPLASAFFPSSTLSIGRSIPW